MRVRRSRCEGVKDSGFIMLPNLRLVAATIFSTVTLAFFFVAFASYRVAHEGLDRLPRSSAPAIQQLGFAPDEMWSQRDSLNGAVPEIFRSLPQTSLGPERDAGAQTPEITVIEVPASPEPAPAAAGANDADTPVEPAAPAAVAEAPKAETPDAVPPQEPAKPEVVAAVDTQDREPPPAATPAVSPKTAPAPEVKKPAPAAAKPAPKAKTVHRAAAKTTPRARRKVVSRPATPTTAPAVGVVSPAAVKPGARSTSSTNTVPSNPFSSLFQ
jgi:hypothetical protein